MRSLRYYNVEEVADILGYAPRTVLGFVQRGLLVPEPDRDGQRYMFCELEVARFRSEYQPQQGWPKGKPAPGRGWPKGKKRKP